MRRRLPLLLVLLLPSLCAAEPAVPTPWAFRKPVRVDPPHVSDPTWVQNPIDAFVLARLDKAGLKPSPPASKAALLRRVTYDLIGVPPTPKELDDFLADTTPDAYERVVDRLLASPHFGERQAAALARRGPLRRVQRLRGRRRTAQRLALPRLRRPILQRGQAL